MGRNKILVKETKIHILVEFLKVLSSWRDHRHIWRLAFGIQWSADKSTEWTGVRNGLKTGDSALVFTQNSTYRHPPKHKAWDIEPGGKCNLAPAGSKNNSSPQLCKLQLVTFIFPHQLPDTHRTQWLGTTLELKILTMMRAEQRTNWAKIRNVKIENTQRGWLQ